MPKLLLLKHSCMYAKRGGVAAYHIVWLGLCLRSVPGVRVLASAVDDSSTALAGYLHIYTGNKLCFGVYNVAPILPLLYVVHAMLFPMMKVLDFYVVSTFRITCRVPNMAVFYRSLMSCFSDMFSGILLIILR